MKAIDISMRISPRMPVYPGDPPVEIDSHQSIPAGDPANVSRLRLGSHTGTHIDAPSHFIDGGPSIDEIDVERFIGDCFVANATASGTALGPAELESLRIPAGVERLLLRTGGSALLKESFPREYTSVSPEGARWIVDQGIHLAGIDFLTIEPPSSMSFSTHRTLLSNDVLILEGLDLTGVAAGRYRLSCLPVAIAGGDGAWTRAVLFTE